MKRPNGRRWFLLALATSALCLPACTKPPMGVDGGDAIDLRPEIDQAGPPDLAVAPVRGSLTECYLGEGAELTRPRDLRSVAIAALVPQSGGFTLHQGEGHEDGTFEIQNVPKGRFYLKIADTYLVTSERVLDLRVDLLGRPDRTLSASPLDATFQLRGLSPWQSGDEVTLSAPAAGVLARSVDSHASPPIGAGSVEIRDLQVPWVDLAPPGYLIDSAKGDRVLVLQLSSRRSDRGFSYRAVSRAGALPSVTMKDGQPVSFVAELSEPMMQAQVELTLPLAKYDALLSAQPGALPKSAQLAVSSLPFGKTRGLYENAAALVHADIAHGVSSLETGKLHYGNPMSAPQEAFVVLQKNFALEYKAPAASRGRVELGAITVETDLQSASQGELAPLTPPVSGAQIGERDFTADQGGLGETPQIRFQIPKEANGARVQVYRLYEEAGSTRKRLLMTLYTTDGDVRIPPGIMAAGMPGSAYYVRVSAIRSAEFASQPLRRRLPYGSADLFSGMILP